MGLVIYWRLNKQRARLEATGDSPQVLMTLHLPASFMSKRFYNCPSQHYQLRAKDSNT